MAALAVGLVGLAGCAVDPTEDGDLTLNTTTQVGSPPPGMVPPPVPTDRPTPPARRVAELPVQAAEIDASELARSGAIAFREDDGPINDFDAIVGYPEEELRRLFGDPAMVEDRPPAFTWQYASETCTLDLYFFMEVSTNTFRVLAYDLKSRIADAPNLDRRCLSELVQSTPSS
ncbi:MAG: hypothetical protein RID91_17910 [Azospirillaceae bacterium]